MRIQLVWAVLALLSMSIGGFAQGHENHQDAAEQVAEPEHIFCPTMKTGQLCTHGTAANLGLSGEDFETFRAIARVYNQRVNQATEQLFKDAEAMLGPAEMELLKAWFAVGLNPEINALLYEKGLYGDAPEAASKAEPAR